MKLKLFVGVAAICGGLLSAQEVTTPAVEIGLGYSGVRINSAGDNSHQTGNGGSGSFEFNLNRYLGLVGDVGGYANTKIGIKEDLMTYMFGPRFNLRFSRVNPYVQTLFGGGYAWSGGNNQNAFAMAVGGGVDVKLTQHVAIKPIQVEYLRTQFNSENLGGATAGFGDHQNSVRYSAGIVFQFGQR